MLLEDTLASKQPALPCVWRGAVFLDDPGLGEAEPGLSRFSRPLTPRRPPPPPPAMAELGLNEHHQN